MNNDLKLHSMTDIRAIALRNALDKIKDENKRRLIIIDHLQSAFESGQQSVFSKIKRIERENKQQQKRYRERIFEGK